MYCRAVSFMALVSRSMPKGNDTSRWAFVARASHASVDPIEGTHVDLRRRSVEIGHDSRSACETLRRGGIVSGRMASSSKKHGVRRHSSSRRIIVVIVPPVDELDLVGPLQVFNSVNRLAGRPIYTIEVVTNANRLTVQGEGGVLTFIAKHHFDEVEGNCDSVLVVCGLGSRAVRDA